MSSLRPTLQRAPPDGIPRKVGATCKLNGKTPFKVKEESPWRMYNKGYDLRVVALVTVAKKKRPGCRMTKGHPASKVVAIRKLSGSSRNVKFSTLLRLQGEYLIKCTGAYKFGADFYLVLNICQFPWSSCRGPRSPERDSRGSNSWSGRV